MRTPYSVPRDEHRLLLMPLERSPSDAQNDDSGAWPVARWLRILDRMELRQPDVGLKFWGPPLWLEVTMKGSDSDRWDLTDQPEREWNWQSSSTCPEIDALALTGANDDELLAPVSRYTIENLILNAAHEIGEWLRLDGQRIFPAHSPRPAPGETGQVGADLDGNGAVHLEVGFPYELASLRSAPSPPNDVDRSRLRYLTASLAPSRFSYLAGTVISYEYDGPVVTRSDGSRPWREAWSADVLQAATGSDLAGPIGRNVHRALVHHEADRICRAFHIDGNRVWAMAPSSVSGHDVDPEGPSWLDPLTVDIVYASA